MAPNGIALQAIVIVDEVPSPGDYLIAGLSQPGDVSWSGYFGINDDGSREFRTYLGVELPTKNAKMPAPDFDNIFEHNVYYPELKGMGVGGEMGQNFVTSDDGRGVWYLWIWSFGPEEDEVPEFNAFIGQYDKATDTYFAYEDTISLNMIQMGATQLTIASATALFASLSLF